MNFEKIKYYILSGLWNEKMAKIAIKKGIITQQQYEDIINEKEEASDLNQILAELEAAMKEGVESIG